jgi:hypothetical protein
MTGFEPNAVKKRFKLAKIERPEREKKRYFSKQKNSHEDRLILKKMRSESINLTNFLNHK